MSYVLTLSIISVIPVDPGSVIQDVRLADGVSNSSGRIEVLHNGEWGTVCEDGWNLTDSDVVCRQLGYPTAEVTYRHAFFGEGSGFIWSNELQCNGNESYLSECKQDEFRELVCNHRQDVGVFCGSKRISVCWEDITLTLANFRNNPYCSANYLNIFTFFTHYMLRYLGG
ncbi:Soluble scavenger receptor cysteine-rich domain-containing protein SSC5D [Holothuria leucospilota]|uniref:Soluble scavenger receptor cysteine-rich domain-containing protein SSC5D n=1 Tax=Holothuria leucospilota TaxID=206669 RepID=A0A9Q1CCG1_HOLLE|nr:Soluble scavenger receptor cysteine-rich domain-containing protein SSC5D [Holothuria leucospilota]